MKTIQEIAQFIVERRLRASPVILKGELLAALESEGLTEALQRRWLVPDYDGGNLLVTSDATRVAELMDAAKLPPTESRPVESASASPAVNHANRPHQYLSEIGSPGIGNPSGPASPMAPAPAATPTSPSPKREPEVGDDVGIAEGGKTYTGKVASRSPQGRFSLSFGSEKPPVQRDYGVNELRLMPTGSPMAHA